MADSFRLLNTNFGYIGVVASSVGLRRIYLPERARPGIERAIRKEFPAARPNQRLLPDLVANLKRYFAGAPVTFTVPIDTNGMTPFQTEIYRACRGIKYGTTRSYKELAELAGRGGAARAAGTALSRNSCPIVIPCHRVLCSGGGLGGFSAPGGLTTKLRLLRMEAAAVKA